MDGVTMANHTSTAIASPSDSMCYSEWWTLRTFVVTV